MNNFKFIILVLIIINGSVFSQNRSIIVMKNDSTKVSGEMISISPEKVVIHTDGIVSKLVLYKGEISEVHFTDSNQRITYPISNIEALSEFGFVPQKKKTKKVFPARQWSIGVNSGVGNSSFSTEFENIDIDYECTSIYEIFLRWHQPVEYRKKAGKFVELSYYHAGLRSSTDTWSLSFEKNVAVNSYALDYGYNSGDLGRNSYFFISGGLSFLAISDHEDSGLNSSYFGLRVGLGTVQGIIPRLSVQFKVLLDLAIAGFGQNTGIAAYGGQIYETYEPGIHPDSDGGSMNFLVGIMYDF